MTEPAISIVGFAEPYVAHLKSGEPIIVIGMAARSSVDFICVEPAGTIVRWPMTEVVLDYRYDKKSGRWTDYAPSEIYGGDEE